MLETADQTATVVKRIPRLYQSRLFNQINLFIKGIFGIGRFWENFEKNLEFFNFKITSSIARQF